MRILKFAALMLGALTLTLPTLAPVQAQANRNGAKAHGGGGKAHNRAGAPTGKAKSNVNKPKPSSNYQRPSQGNNKSAGNKSANNRSGNNNKVSNQQAYKAGQASGNRNQRDVVVVNGGHGNGYYDNGRYNDRPDWDDDDDDFLEFVGKTAAITAGVSAVAAVIGSVSNDKPDDCQPVNSNGTSYLYCNGTYYQQVQQGGQPAYQVVAPPQ